MSIPDFTDPPFACPPHPATGNVFSLKWKPAHDALLTQHAASGKLSYNDICGEINAAFGTTYTRNATIGRAKRLGLLISNPRVNGAHILRPKREPKERVRKPAPPKILPIEVLTLRCAEIEPKHIALLDLQSGHCRWPYGDDNFTFCGHEKLEGSSYCALHYQLLRKVAA